MALLATLYNHRRAAERQALAAGATLRIDGNPYDVIIANISASGCLFICEHQLEIGDTILIGITGLGRRDARIVRTLGSRFGAEFVTPLLASEVEAAGATSNDSVVPLFPWPVVERSANLDDLSHNPTATRRTRVIILAGLVASSWTIILIALHIAK